eukprot:RCo024696
MSTRFVHSPYSFEGMVVLSAPRVPPSALQDLSPTGPAPATPPTITSAPVGPSVVRPSLPAGFPAPLPPLVPSPAPQPCLPHPRPLTPTFTASTAPPLSLSRPTAQALPCPASACLFQPHHFSAPGRPHSHGGSPPPPPPPPPPRPSTTAVQAQVVVVLVVTPSSAGVVGSIPKPQPPTRQVHKALLPGVGPFWGDNHLDLEALAVWPVGGDVSAAPASSAAGEEPLALAPTCSHTATWRRVRGKRGYGHYHCHTCGAKWKTRQG